MSIVRIRSRKHGRKNFKALHFKSKEAYMKWLAYGHMHSKSGKLLKYPETKTKSMMAVSKTDPDVYIRGKKHKVKHDRKKT